MKNVKVSPVGNASLEGRVRKRGPQREIVRAVGEEV